MSTIKIIFHDDGRGEGIKRANLISLMKDSLQNNPQLFGDFTIGIKSYNWSGASTDNHYVEEKYKYKAPNPDYPFEIDISTGRETLRNPCFEGLDEAITTSLSSTKFGRSR